jgi:exodeoxyribonuclease VII large subunit
MQSHTLLELNEFIRQVLALNLPDALWVRCELAQAKQSRGHFYFDVVQKDEKSAEPAAQGQAILWQKDYKRLLRKLGEGLHSLLQEGVEVLFLVKVEFNERYGLKMIIEDFDPAYTIGRLEMQRQETIRQLSRLQLLEKNKALPLPPVLQRIALITSETAAGYQDFLHQLSNNPYGYHFTITLFPAAMQGPLVLPEILSAFSQIANKTDEFDVAIILRGGGSKLDLAAFDQMDLCKAAALFPLPLLTGIGHEVDETVLDLVAHTALKTPTAVAEFILHRSLAFESEVQFLSQKLTATVSQQLINQALMLQSFEQSLRFHSHQRLEKSALMLSYIENEIPASLRHVFQKEKLTLDGLEKAVLLLSPETALRRGFSITSLRGKPLRDATSAAPGDQLETRLLRGKIVSTIKEIHHE